MILRTAAAVITALTVLSSASTDALAWGGRGHRIVAAVAALLIPDKAARLDQIVQQLEMDSNFIDAASYPDEFIRNHDPNRQFSSQHFADLPDDGSQFDCASQNCLFDALSKNLGILRQGNTDKDTAVAITWVIHLVGDLHQPLHMSGRDRGGNDFHVKYRGEATCPNFTGGHARVELHSVWDDCLVEELAGGMSTQDFAKQLVGDITTFNGRPEVQGGGDAPWLAWGDESHTLANSVAFDSLQQNADLEDPYIKGQGHALDIVRQQLLVAGIRLAFLLDQNFQ
jgi:hypothetical protein